MTTTTSSPPAPLNARRPAVADGLFRYVSLACGLAVLAILALIAILASLIQIFLLIARGGLVVVLGGTWPLSAAASSTPAGNAWFKKTTAWLLAFILFKPVASIIYAAALRLTLSKTSGGLETVEGVMLLAITLFPSGVTTPTTVTRSPLFRNP